MLQPMANPSMKRNRKRDFNELIFSFIELRHELDSKTEEIKKLSYEISTRLKSTQPKKVIAFRIPFVI
jgi:hypothetical protein